MPKHTESEYTQKLKNIADSGFRFHSLPATEEQFWGDEKEASRTKRTASSIGSTAAKAAGIVGNVYQVAPLYALSAASKGNELLWRGTQRTASYLEGAGIGELLNDAASNTKEKLIEGRDRTIALLGRTAIAETLKDSLDTTLAKGYLDPFGAQHIYRAASGTKEKLHQGKSKAASYLGGLNIGEKMQNKAGLPAIKRQAAKNINRSQKRQEKLSAATEKRWQRIDDIFDQPKNPKWDNRFLMLAEKNRKAAAKAHASGRYAEATTLMKRARTYQRIYREGIARRRLLEIETSQHT